MIVIPPRLRSVGFAPKPEVLVTLRLPPMAVFVCDANGRPLAPMSPARARQLISDGKAHFLDHPTVPMLAFTTTVDQPARDPLLLSLSVVPDAVVLALLYRDLSGVRVAAQIAVPLAPLSTVSVLQALELSRRSNTPLGRGAFTDIRIPNWPQLRSAAPLLDQLIAVLASIAPISHLSVFVHYDGFMPPVQQDGQVLPVRVPNGVTVVNAATSQRGTMLQPYLDHVLRLARRSAQTVPTHVAGLVQHLPKTVSVNADQPPLAVVAPPHLLLPERPNPADTIGRVGSFRLTHTTSGVTTLVRGVITAHQFHGAVTLLVPIAAHPAPSITWQPFTVDHAAVIDWFPRTDMVVIPILRQRRLNEQ